MAIINESDESAERMRNFATIYRAKLAAKPLMEITARYESMTEAGLNVLERIEGDVLIETNRLNELLPLVKPCLAKPNQ